MADSMTQRTDGRKFAAQGDQPLEAVHAGHLEIQDHQIHRLGPQHLKGVGKISGLQNLGAGGDLLDERAQPFTDHDVIIGQDDAHGLKLPPRPCLC